MEVKSNKPYLYVLMSLFMFTLYIGETKATTYENYFGIEMNNEQYNNLLELGFNEDEIYYMDEQTFEDNKDLSATLVAKTEKYYKTIYTDLNGTTHSLEITKEEYDRQSTLNTRGTVSTGYKTMVSTISQVSNKFRYKVTVAWKQIPSVHNYDIIGVGFEDPVSISGAVNFNYTYALSDGSYITDTLYYDKKKTTTGGSAVYKIPNDIYSLGAVLYYDVTKDTTSTITELNMCGDYAHATQSISGTNYTNYDITINGIELGSNILSKYDAIPCAISTWYGSW